MHLLFVSSLLCAVSLQAQTPAPHAAGSASTEAPAAKPETAPKPEAAIDRPWQDISVWDTYGKARTLARVKEQVKPKAIIVVAINSDCPIAQLYLEKLKAMEKSFREQKKDVLIIALNSAGGESMGKVRSHRSDNELSFPVWKEFSPKLATALHLTRTPEAAVLDGDLNLKYRGAIDDQYSVGSRKSKVDEDYLGDAVTSVLGGTAVKRATTPVEGCPIDDADPEIKAAHRKLTYNKDIGPILQKKCEPCHREGQAAPFPIQSYEDVQHRGKQFTEVLRTERMPPWGADRHHYHHGGFVNERNLTDEERQKILDWVRLKMPEGEGDPAEPKIWNDGWAIGKPDTVLRLAKPFAVKASGDVDYQYIEVPTNFDKEVWAKKIEVRPGGDLHPEGAKVVHHLIAHITGAEGMQVNPLDVMKKARVVRQMYAEADPDTRADFFSFSQKMAKINALYDPEKAAVLGSFVPGEGVRVAQDGTAIRIPKGSRIVVEAHYTPDGKERLDQSEVGIVFTDAPEREIRTNPLGHVPLKIPAGEPAHREIEHFTFPHDAEILSLQPHMHWLGQDMRYRLLPPKGKTLQDLFPGQRDPDETILSVPMWDFNWQTTYEFNKPIKVPAGTTIEAIAHWDNSKMNPRNPRLPAKEPRNVGWGPMSRDEMMNGWLTYTEETGSKAPEKKQGDK